MDYVHAHPENFPFNNPQDIPIDDKNIYRLFSGTEVLGVTEEAIGSKVASYAVDQMLKGKLIIVPCNIMKAAIFFRRIFSEKMLCKMLYFIQSKKMYNKEWNFMKNNRYIVFK